MSIVPNKILGVIIVLVVLYLIFFVNYADSVKQLYPRESVNYNVNAELLEINERQENNTIIAVRISKIFTENESDDYRLMHKVVNKTTNTKFGELFELDRQTEDIGEVDKVISTGNIHCRDGFIYIYRETFYNKAGEIVGFNNMQDGDGRHSIGFDAYHIEKNSALDVIAKDVCPSFRY